MLRFHARTDVGLRRQHNEDSLLAAESNGLFVVADGVGGRKAGEIASAITVNTLQSFGPRIRSAIDTFAESRDRDDRNAVLGLLSLAVSTASKKVFEAAEQTGRQGMTTTIVVCAIGAGSAFIAHVGDSRVYLFREGALQQVTEDHSMLNELIRSGAIKPEDADKSPYRNIITRAVGLYPEVKSDTVHFDLCPGDRLLLCSDGLHDMVGHEKLTLIVADPDVSSATQRLIAAALEGGGKDNVTCVLIEPEATRSPDAVASFARVIRTLWLFEDLPDQARLKVGRMCHEVQTKAGDVLVANGSLGHTFYAVIRGVVSVQIDGREIAALGPGQHFGEMALVENEPRTADVIAETDGALLAIDRDAFREFCRTEPTLGNAILWKLVATLGQRLRTVNQQLRNTL